MMKPAQTIPLYERPAAPGPSTEPDSKLVLRVAVPLVLAAGWGALIAFSMGFLFDDAQHDGIVTAAHGRAPLTEASGLDRVDPVRTAGILPVPDPAWPKRSEQRWPDQVREPAGEIGADGPPPKIQTVAATVPDTSPEVVTRSLTPNPGPAVIRSDYVGVWGPTASACNTKTRGRRAYLPATITEETAQAGRVKCRFRSDRRIGSTWTMAADCTDRGRRWTSQVKLIVDGDRLTWTSAKGRQAYVRCER